MEDVRKMIKSLKESGLLVKGISETIKNEEKKTKIRIFFNVIRNISS